LLEISSNTIPAGRIETAVVTADFCLCARRFVP
jgi:hypothetical protein